MTVKRTGISFVDHSWNPWSGCTKVAGSAGCDFCYAERIVENFGMRGRGNPVFSKIVYDTTPLEQQVESIVRPIYGPDEKWYPARVFVNSMSDFFHKAVPDSRRDSCMDIMERHPRVCWLIITKRADTMVEYLTTRYASGPIPPQFWIGVTVEDASHYDRLDALRELKAKVGLRVAFVSFEPLLGSVRDANLKGVDWAIIGGESYWGNIFHADRAMTEDVATDTIRMLRRCGITVHFKQWGTWEANPYYAAADVAGHEAKIEYLIAAGMEVQPPEPHGGSTIHVGRHYLLIRESPAAFHELAAVVDAEERAAAVRKASKEPALPTVEQLKEWLVESPSFTLFGAADFLRVRGRISRPAMTFVRPGDTKPLFHQRLMEAVRELQAAGKVVHDADLGHWVVERR